MTCPHDASKSGAGAPDSVQTERPVLTRFTLSDAAQVLGAELVGSDDSFTAVSTDTRTIEKGALFVALEGPSHDGHNYLAEAREKGAAGALVSRKLNGGLPMLVVRDTRLALGQLAAAWRAGFRIPVVAVTGSNGKTTVKEMIASILGRAAPVLSTLGNLNNDIGVPLTLLRLRPEHRYAVIEMGANHGGEIRYLTSLAKPDISVITNAGGAHLAGFGDVRGVARAKGEIIEGLTSDGTAILNADDANLGLWKSLAGSRFCLTFGIQNVADVWAKSGEIAMHVADVDTQSMRLEIHFRLYWSDGDVAVKLPLAGRHNVMNALAAAAAALAVGVSGDAIRAGLEDTGYVQGRLQLRRGIRGIRILDDTYNANPASLAAGIEVLVALTGAKVLVLGDMAELGTDAAVLHADMGRKARISGVERLYGYGALCRAAVEAFGKHAAHFDSLDALIPALRAEVPDAANVLVKGSRCMQMEKVVTGLLEPRAGAKEG